MILKDFSPKYIQSHVWSITSRNIGLLCLWNGLFSLFVFLESKTEFEKLHFIVRKTRFCVGNNNFHTWNKNWTKFSRFYLKSIKIWFINHFFHFNLFFFCRVIDLYVEVFLILVNESLASIYFLRIVNQYRRVTWRKPRFSLIFLLHSNRIYKLLYIILSIIETGIKGEFVVCFFFCCFVLRIHFL